MTPVFAKILIANRGEIACRVIRTARRLGIATVAVYSEADADALHVRMADEAVAIGPAPAAESYLVIDRIVEAARATAADAVHPGYGFLAENPAFVEAVEAAGITFIGPGADAIRAMGDKLASKRLAKAAGVNTIPGHDAILTDADEAVEVARAVGYPVMIKASAGGGGKGMRIARNDDEAREGFRAARSEAQTSFGDDRVLIERFIEEPRHIEIQVLADRAGNAIYLGERECSIQRRHQKVIEEAPSPFLDPATRAAMGTQAVALARAVGYHSAGTVEFIVDAERNFYFLEMNTRLQVEHPVTEAVTGLDLVEHMIRIAGGEPLALTQAAIKAEGWAIEGRVYAEDPSRGFLPAPGRLTRYRPPTDEPGLRVDTGVYEGAEVSLYYDPMIAKVIAHGATREEAASRLALALDAFDLAGPGHNLDFLAAVMDHPRFQAGRLSTAFIDEEYGPVFGGAAATGDVREAVVAMAVLAHLREQARAQRIEGRLPGAPCHLSPTWVVHVDDGALEVEAALTDTGARIVVDGKAVTVESTWAPGQRVWRGAVGGRKCAARIGRAGSGWHLAHRGWWGRVDVLSPRASELAALMPVREAADTSRYLLAPMPGRVVSIAVAAGDEVRAGDALAVIDAMKMENVLRAERDACVSSVRAAPGDSLNTDDIIMEFA